MNVLALCAGVAGLELGIRIAEPRAVCVAYLEREAAAAATLVARMEEGWLHPAPVWSDLATFDPRRWRGLVDCVASGDPCQPNSLAGKRQGRKDDRWLVDHVLRIVEGIRPDRFFRENVPGNTDGQLEAFIPALEAMGYRVAAGIFSAAEARASHKRERLFVMADADGIGRWRQGDQGQPPDDAAQSGERLADTSDRQLPEPGGDCKDEQGLDQQARTWATPRASDGEKGGPNSRDSSGSLHLTSQTRQWATPAARLGDRRAPQAKRYGDPKRHGGVNLDDQVAAIWPTPIARDHRSIYAGQETMEKNSRPLSEVASQFSHQDRAIPDGQKSSDERRTLNPRFVEWMHGWPIGWTNLEPVETESRVWLRRMRGALSTLICAAQRKGTEQPSLFAG